MAHCRLSLCGLLMAAPAVAQIRGVVLQPPERDFGYFVGDTLVATAAVSLAPGTVLDARSLPVVGQLGPGLDIRNVTVSNLPGAPESRLLVAVEYQNFVAPEQVIQVRVPAYSLEFHRGPAQFIASVPYWSFYTSPLRHERLAVADQAALRPDHAVPLVSVAGARRGVFAALGISLAAGFVLARERGWLPRLGRRPGPFASAATRIAALAKRADDPMSYSNALLALHRAFDATAGRRVLAGDIPSLLQQHVSMTPSAAAIDLFFRASHTAFFVADMQAAERIAPLSSLADLARQLRRVERTQ